LLVYDDGNVRKERQRAAALQKTGAMKKRWLKLMLILSAAAIFLLLLGISLLHIPLARRLVFEQVRTRLLKTLAIDVRANRFHYNLFTREITLEDLTVRSVSAPDLPPIFRADRIYVKPALLSIIKGSWDFEDLLFASPKIHYFVGRDGKNNLPQTASDSGSAPEFLIAHAKAGSGSFQFDDLSKNFSMTFPQWQLQVDGKERARAHKIGFSILRPASIQYRAKTIPVEQLKVSGMLQGSTFRADAAYLSAADSQISITGSVSGFSNPRIDLQLQPNMDLQGIARALNSRATLEGNIAGTIQLRGALDDLHMDVRLRGAGIRALGHRTTNFDLSSRADWNSSRLRVHRVEMNSPEGYITGSAELFAKSGEGTNSVKAELRDFNLSPVWKLLRSPFDLASRATGRLSLSWDDAFDPLKMSGSARLNLVATQQAPGPSVLAVSGKLDAELHPGRTLVNLESVSALGSRLSGEFSLRSFREIDGDFRGDAPDVDTLITQLSRFFGGSDNPTGTIKLKGPIQFNARVSGKLKSPAVSITSHVPELQAGVLKHLSARTNGKIEGSQITFQGTVTLPESATVHTQGSLDISGRAPLLNLNAHGRGIPAIAVAKVLDSALPVSGDLNAQLHLEGTPDELAGYASIEGVDLSLYREPLGRLDIDLHLADKEIQSTQCTLLKDPLNPASGRIDAQFTYALDSDRFQFQASGKDLQLKRLALPNGTPMQGTWKLAASGSGTIEQPAIDIKMGTDDFQVRQRSLGPIALNAVLKNNDLKLEAAAPRLEIDSTALVAGETPYLFSGELHIRNSDLALLGFKAANGQSLTGTIEADVTGSGNLKDFAQSHFSAQIKNLRLQAGGLELHTEELTHAEYRDNSLEIPAATIVSGNSRLRVSGRVPLHQPAPPGELSLKGQMDLAQAAGFALLPEGYAAAGLVNLDLALAGTPQKPVGSGTLTLNSGVLNFPGIQTPLTDIALRAAMHDGSVILQQADASWDQGKIALTGEFPLGLLPKNVPVQIPRKEGPAVFSLDITNFRPEATGKLPLGMSGLVSLHAEGTAAQMDLRALNAQLDFSNLRFRANEIALEQKQPSTILLHDGIAEISRMSLGGADTSIKVSGSSGLLPGSSLDLRLTGNLNTALLTFMSRDLKATGRLKVWIVAVGDRKAPSLFGLAEMNGGKLSLRNPRVVADSLTMRLALDPKQITVREFKGTLNGGLMKVTGTVHYRDGILSGLNLTATMQDSFFNLPEGLKSSSSGTLAIASSEDAIVVSGNVRAQESSYRESFEVTGQLMSYLKAQQLIVADREPDPLLDRVQLNIALRTETPLLVQNNIAKVGGTANVQLVGPFNEPSLVGRITLEDGGEIIVNRQTYYINRGTITLANQTRIEPEIDIQAQTKIGSYDVTLQMTGPLERLTTTLSSEPPLSQADIAALLLTGKTTSEAQGREIQTARTQALALIVGQAGEELTDEARRALHLSTLRIDPGLIASESDPGARLTLGQDITRKLSFVYSMNLTNGGDQIWSTEYEIARRLTTQATKQQDNSYRFEFSHNLLFGKSSSNRRTRTTAQNFKIGEIIFEGGAPFSDKTLTESFKVKSGQKYDFPKVQKGLDRLHDFYAGQGHLEANVRMHRDTVEKTVHLNLNVDPGPVVEFAFEGMPLPEGVRKEVQKAWKNGAIDIERIEDAIQAIRMPLLEDGFLQSEITYKTEFENDHKTVRFQITPGVRYANVSIVFAGASAIPATELNKALDQADLRLNVYANPQKVADMLHRFYGERGYLQASVDLPSPQLDPRTATGKTIIQIREGALFTIGELEFNGHRAFNYDELWAKIPTSSGSSYDPNTLQDAVKALENLYRSKGYNDASITYRIVLDTARARANLSFYIVERRQSLIRDIAIEGNQGTSPDFVRRQLAFGTGDALDFTKINETRRRLYSSGVYSSIDFQTEEMPAIAPDPRIKDVRVRIRVREVRPYRLQYGFFYDTDRGPGGIMEAENRNFLGRALDLGLRLRYDSDLKEGRLYFYQPFVTKIHIKTDASAFVQRETRPAFEANRIGFSLFQERNLPRSFRVDYGYRYDHVRWNGIPPDPTIFQASVPVARLITTLSRDTRDSVLDATRGEFSSHSLEFGPRFLGSEIGFTRYYGQYFRYIALDKFLLKKPSEKERKSAPKKLIYAGALRLGLTTAFGGGSVISPERFFAGGGTTMRGFAQDRMGTLETLPDGTQRPLGGEALFLFNNELRFPIFGILQGVGFVDIGNVYSRISDFDFSIRKSAGAGIRLKIKFIPLRFDYGLKLDRKPGESRGSFFFSIGQAF
jgi:outer membrane protein assembly complex protein YaeT